MACGTIQLSAEEVTSELIFIYEICFAINQRHNLFLMWISSDEDLMVYSSSRPTKHCLTLQLTPATDLLALTDALHYCNSTGKTTFLMHVLIQRLSDKATGSGQLSGLFKAIATCSQLGFLNISFSSLPEDIGCLPAALDSWLKPKSFERIMRLVIKEDCLIAQSSQAIEIGIFDFLQQISLRTPDFRLHVDLTLQISADHSFFRKLAQMTSKLRIGSLAVFVRDALAFNAKGTSDIDNLTDAILLLRNRIENQGSIMRFVVAAPESPRFQRLLDQQMGCEFRSYINALIEIRIKANAHMISIGDHDAAFDVLQRYVKAGHPSAIYYYLRQNSWLCDFV